MDRRSLFKALAAAPLVAVFPAASIAFGKKRIAPAYAGYWVHTQEFETLSVVVGEMTPFRAMKQAEAYVEQLGGPQDSWPRV